MVWTLRTLIVPSAHVALARELCERLPPGGSGSGMFSTPLNATGTGSPTHYISSGLIEQQFADLMTQPAMVYAASQQAGIVTTQAAVTAMLAASDISADEPFAAMARLGLRMVQE
jgi:hypothetical protein